MSGDRAQTLAVIELQDCRSAAPQRRVRLFQHRVEHRREVAGRGIDDLQHLGGRGLLLQGLARLGDEPRVLHRDHRLRREILQQRDLLVGERPHFVAVGDNMPEQASSLRSGTDQQERGAMPSSTQATADIVRIAPACSATSANMDETLAGHQLEPNGPGGV